MTNKQIELIAEIVLDKLRALRKQTANDEQVKQQAGERVDNHPWRQRLLELQQLQEQQNEINKKVAELQEFFYDNLGTYRYAPADAVSRNLFNQELEALVTEKVGFELPRQREVERMVMLADDNNVEKIVENILDKITT